MSLDDATEARILQKVEYVDEATTVLARKQALTESEYLDEREQRSIVEREFQTAIEACIDVGQLLIRATGDDVPGTNAEAFELLGERGLISSETAEHMQEAAGFRNVLAHNYGEAIDDEQVYAHLQEDLHWFPTFLGEIRDCLAGDEVG